MITRIEIDGFKSFLDFQLDIPPFLALVGPNSSGKSNLLDALDYLSRSRWGGEDPLLTARRGRWHELFHRVSKGRPVVRFDIRADTLAPIGAGLLPVTYSGGAEPGVGPVPIPMDLRFDPDMSFAGQGPPWMADLREKALTELWGELAATAPEGDKSSRYLRLKELEPSTWRLHQPNPERLRASSSSADNGPLRADGSNLATVLGRLEARGVIEDFLVDLVALIPDIAGIEPILDERRQEWTFDVLVDGQGAVPSTLLSDGTLRVIALLAALHDPDHAGVLLIEEIENGLHPSRLAELLRRIQGRVTDLSDPECVNRPLRQVILTTHSPVVVSELYRLRPDALVFLDTAVRVDPERDRISRVTVAKPVRAEGEPGTFVSPRQVRKYLSAVGEVP
ncbi:AAA family ATPase [Microbispora sp. H11081]|uniref:AAA family ATPase n=1 Tax=Microbispora sp. H11081 TaxID=2729107 RepID=UPI0014749D3D|nr:ATP-binding protein [Microbispora sp. H11081]